MCLRISEQLWQMLNICTGSIRGIIKPVSSILIIMLAILSGTACADKGDHSSGFDIDSASWSTSRERLTIRGNCSGKSAVTVTNADTGASVGSDNCSRSNYRIRKSYSSSSDVPCRVLAEQGGSSDERNVRNAPANCDDGGDVTNTPPTAKANGPYTGTTGVAVDFSSAGSNDSDGNIDGYAWNFGDGSSSTQSNPSHSYADPGTYTVTLTVTDNDGASDSDSTTVTISDQPPVNVAPTANDDSYNATAGVQLTVPAPGVLGNDSDPDAGDSLTVATSSTGSHTTSAGGSVTLNSDGSFTYDSPAAFSGNDTFSYSAFDGTASSPAPATVTIAVTYTPPLPIADISINSVSTNGLPNSPVVEQLFAGINGYKVFASNDLGMHCGDLDTRVSSILPPFNVLHAQVLQQGSEPNLLDKNDGITVVYSAASNPDDPILSGLTSTGLPVASSMLADGSVYKTNFWDTAFQAYDPFYPDGILDLFWPAGTVNRGLPMPDVEAFYLGSGNLSADQQDMPGHSMPYIANDASNFEQFVGDMPFFINFPFGYTASNVNWFEAAGVPMTAFDDYGRENPWPLYRVQAKSGGNVLASLDTVLPISGEANCGACHNHPDEAVMLGGNGEATQNMAPADIATVLDDPEEGGVPLLVSLEYAADLNLVRLHDQKHGTNLEGEAPVVCQRCHYTPALDLAQLGPLGPENDASADFNGGTLHTDSLANGRDQVVHKSMSNVMHSHHSETGLFPDMPPPIDGQGNLRGGIENPVVKDILEATCYQCHPGRRTDCLRGAMASGGMVCQDCHGNMAQVGNDFTRNVPEHSITAELAPDFYTNPATPRVPWANEPGCGSCHTGDASNNMHGDPGTVGAPDGIRLMQTYLTTESNSLKVTPIVPSNKRFAENTVPTGDPGSGNPMLYRVSTGHGGMFCEACHGSTHGEWPNKNPRANDNIAANQLQGHAGVIIECSTCHGSTMNNQITLDGPHGMHPVGDNTSFADGGHEHLAENNSSACAVCHGPGSRSTNQGTVLSLAKADRNLRGTLVQAGEPVGCAVCHSGGDD